MVSLVLFCYVNDQVQVGMHILLTSWMTYLPICVRWFIVALASVAR